MTTSPVSPESKLEALSTGRAKLLELLLNRDAGDMQIRPVPRDRSALETGLQTSCAQQRLWFIDQLEGGGAAYNIRVVLRLTGDLDREALQQALGALLRRHEVLRTAFASIEGEPRQLIAAAGPFALRVIDLTHHEECECEAQVQLQKLEEGAQLFDLGTGPLIRGRLLHLRPQQHVLLITMHHIVSDGWSMGVLARELGDLYSAYRDGHEDPLPSLPIQYADYASWQRHRLQSEVLDKQLSYWRQHLEGAPPELTLPIDRPRPAVQSYRGQNAKLTLDAQLTGDLTALARRHGMTLFMVLYAGWAILLSRLSGQEDLVVGTPVANRRRPELENLIGFFVNTLAVRVAVPGRLALREFLQHVKEVMLAAFDHQELPFERLVEALRPPRSLNVHPVFQVMFVLQNTPPAVPSWSGLAAVPEESVNETSKFDLLLSLQERGAELVGVVNYDTEIFTAQTIERWIGCLRVLLEAMAGHEQETLESLPILPLPERRQVLEVFNATAVEYSRHKLIHELFEEQARRTPDATAVAYRDRRLSYAQLQRQADCLAQYLREQGVCRNEVVGLCVKRSLEMVVGLLGILKAGAGYMPLDPNYPADRLQYMLQDAAPRVVLTQSELVQVLPATTAQIIELDSKLAQLSASGARGLQSRELGQEPGDLLYVIYTSGSTGWPKGTAMPHAAMVNLIEWQRGILPGSAQPRVLQFAALSFDVAFQETFSTLCTGGTLVLLDEWVRRDARALTELLREQRVERMFVPPLMLQSLAEYSSSTGMVPGSLRDVITAGEQLRISPEIVSFFERLPGCRLHNHYGPTETHVVTALTLAGDPQRWPALPSIGAPIANTRIYLLDGQRQPVPQGVVGEIYIAGANLARGYLHREQLTAERFVADAFDPQEQGRMYKTGDLGRWLADGTIEYLGRNDDQVKLRGHRIELSEIEAQLMLHEQVREAAVVAREDVPGEKRLVAYFTRCGSLEVSAERLRAHLKGVLPEHMVPSAYVMLESLPLTPSGKLNRRALPAPQTDDYLGERHEPAQGEIEQALAAIWQELLHLGRVGRNDNFFNCGGHSLLVLKALFKINQSLGCNLAVTDMYKSPTLRELAARIAGVSQQEQPVDLSQEARLDPQIQGRPGACQSPADAMLLTGATGFIGRFLLAHLLEATRAKVYCLIRSHTQREADDRLIATLSGWDLWRDALAERVIAVPGDLRLPGVGIDRRTYDMLAERVDCIYHCATSMNHLETYAAAKAANVDSLQELLKLATRHKTIPFNQISTLGVFSARDAAAPRVVDEQSPIDRESHTRAAGYVASKWVGEKLCMLAGERGVPCNIFRLGLVWADTQQGRYDDLQRGYRMIKSALLCGYGVADYRYEAAPLPVDYVVRAVTCLAEHHAQGGGIFHIASSSPMTAGLFELCNEILAEPLELLSLYDWIGRIKQMHREGRPTPMTPLLEFAFSMDQQAFQQHQRRLRAASVRADCARTQRELEAAGIVAPSFDANLLRASLQSMVSRDPQLGEIRSARLAPLAAAERAVSFVVPRAAADSAAASAIPCRRQRHEMLRRMLRIRLFEERAALMRPQLSGFLHNSIGQEAEIVGACMALRADDYMTGNHRSHGHPIGKGAELAPLMAELFGKRTGVCRGKGGSMHLAVFSAGSLGESGIVGSLMPVAVGAGLSARLRGTDQVCLCFFGDGAANCGPFHESLNLAAIWRLPVVFLCENNGYATFSPQAETTAIRDIARRADSYGMPGVVVDGQDVLAVHETVGSAVARARAGGGPSLIEAKTYRYCEHAEFGAAFKLPPYRTAAEVEQWRSRDPIELFATYLCAGGELADAELGALRSAVQAEIDAAVAFAEQSPVPEPQALFEDLFI